jgi:hypothetical protein
MYAAHALCFVGALLDDAFISFRYAHNLERGLGLVFNAGERVEGYTNFAWVCLAALGLRVGIDLTWLIPGLALLCGITLIYVVAKAAKGLSAEQTPWVAPLLVASHTGLAFYAATGLETVFFSLLLTAAAWALVSRKAWAFALLTSLAFLARPEAGLLGLIGTSLFWLDALRGRRAWRSLAIVCGGFAVLVLPYLAFKQLYFGQLIPNTLSAKEPELLHALRYVGEGLLATAPLIGIALILHLQDTTAVARRQRTEWLALWLAYVLAAVLTGPDWMPAYRLLAHAFPLFAIAADQPLAQALRSRPRNRWLSVTAAALLIYLGMQAFRSYELSQNSRSWVERDAITRALARKMAARGVRTMATINIGLLGYEAPEMTVVDLVGLVDATIGTGPGGHLHKQPTDAYLLSRNIDMFVLTSSQPILRGPAGEASYVPDWPVEAHVFGRPWFNARYAFAGSIQFFTQHYYHLFERRRDPAGEAQSAAAIDNDP